MVFGGMCTSRMLAFIHSVIVSLINSKSLSVATMDVKREPSHGN